MFTARPLRFSRLFLAHFGVTANESAGMGLYNGFLLSLSLYLGVRGLVLFGRMCDVELSLVFLLSFGSGRDT